MDYNSLDDLASFDSEGMLSAEDKPHRHLHHHYDKTHDDRHHELLASPPQHHPASPLYTPVGLTIGHISPGGRSFTSDRSTNNASRSVDSGNNNYYVNAVHMHIQENAKIPNYNQAVDRSNSNSIWNHQPYFGVNKSSRNPHAPPLPSASEEDHHHSLDFNLPNHSADLSMAELFLSTESNQRKSLNQNYENLGSLGASSNSTLHGGPDDLIAMEIDALTAAIDPTPWSEIEDKMHKEARKTHKQQRQTQSDQNHQQQHYTGGHHPHQSSYYPYGRHHQLPIPERVHSPPQQHHQSSAKHSPNPISTSLLSEAEATPDDGMAQAVATAAVIAATSTFTKVTSLTSTTTTTRNIDSRRFPEPSSLARETSISNHHTKNAEKPALNSKSATTVTILPSASGCPDQKERGNKANSNGSVPPRHYQRQRANSSTVSAHAAAHSTSRASVLAAASRKSQYGFGGNHTVPSVPAPPPTESPRPTIVAPTFHTTATNSINATGLRNGSLTSNKNTTTIPSKHSIQTTKLPPSLQNGHVHSEFAGAAYERKKQKAKDARVKLNDAIDRLSIVMSLAGSQSKERLNQLQNNVIETNNVCRQKSIQSNQECLTLSEQAKKWDRPSFVGTAASIIQSLNGQCEALMAELLAMQEQILKTKKCNQSHTSTSAIENSDAIEDKLQPHDVPNNTLDSPFLSNSEPKRHHPESLLCPNDVEPTSNKRPRTDCSPTVPPPLTAAADDDDKSMPDDDAIIFGAVATLLDPLSLCRCPCVSVRWRNLDAFRNDDIWQNLLVKRFGYFNVRQWKGKYEEGDNEKETYVPNKVVYREMDAANVMPHFLQQEGTISLLGSASIPGKVSGWVFLIERSNGETLRSVKRQPGSCENTRTYQSRPVVELRLVVQNTGMNRSPVVLKNQVFAVDVSTRRTGGELVEISWDERFQKVVKNLDGKLWKRQRQQPNTHNTKESEGAEICRLRLFETVVIDIHILANGCSTTSKFCQRSNFTKVLVTLDGTTIPMVVPFLRDSTATPSSST